MNTPLTTAPLALQFLISTLADLYLTAILLLIWLFYRRADPRNPWYQMLKRLTAPATYLLQYMAPVRRNVHWPALLLAFLVTFLKLCLLNWLNFQATPPWAALFIGTLLNLLSIFLTILFWAIIIRAVSSFLGPIYYNPLLSIVFILTEPVLRPIQRILPPLAGLDLSPLFACLGIGCIRILFSI
jgi:YggT family protein